MLRSRRLVLPTLGALALMVSAGAVYRAEAQGGFNLNGQVSPNPVASGGSYTVSATASTGVGKINSVTVQVQGRSFALNLSNGVYSRTLTAPVNNGKGVLTVPVKLTANRSAGSPKSKSLTLQLKVNKRGSGGGNQNPNSPPPPPPI